MSYLPLLLLALWRPPSWAEAINAPSASASTSLSSSLLNLAAAAESTNGGHISPLDQLNSRQECKAKNLKQQQKMFAAKLEAHRCLVRDTVVELPIPDDVIATFVMPSHVVVPRCTGLCLERPGCECVPKKRRHAKVDVIIGTNATNLCTAISVEEHRGGCRCKCAAHPCHYNKEFDETACLCRCRQELTEVKAACAIDFERQWREDSCTCVCKTRICVTGHYQDPHTCQCRPRETTCAVVPAVAADAAVPSQVHSDGEDGGASSSTQAPKYVGLACVVAVALCMLLSLYYMLSRRRSNNSGRPGHGSIHTRGIPVVARTTNGTTATETVVGTLQRTSGGSSGGGRQAAAAYTITINSASAASLDEAILPLTEDKTRF